MKKGRKTKKEEMMEGIAESKIRKQGNLGVTPVSFDVSLPLGFHFCSVTIHISDSVLGGPCTAPHLYTHFETIEMP